MAYRIRYGNDKRSRMNRFWVQCFISMGLGLALFLGSMIPNQNTFQMKHWFMPTQMRTDEIALKDMAESISAGGGWYAAAVAYCREIMELS